VTCDAEKRLRFTYQNRDGAYNQGLAGPSTSLFDRGEPELGDRVPIRLLRDNKLDQWLVLLWERREPCGSCVGGNCEKFQTDPYWRDNVLFFEYFHGDTGAGVGASHQTGWTGCIARIIQANGAFEEEDISGRDAERRAIRLGQGQTAEQIDAAVVAK
jgi:hypothetical protein